MWAKIIAVALLGLGAVYSSLVGVSTQNDAVVAGASTPEVAPVIWSPGNNHNLVPYEVHYHDGGAASDPNNNLNSWRWSWYRCSTPSGKTNSTNFRCPALNGLVSGKFSSLTQNEKGGYDIPAPFFTPTREGTYNLRLTVTDTQKLSATAIASELAFYQQEPIVALMYAEIDGVDDGTGVVSVAKADIKIQVTANSRDLYLLDYEHSGWTAASSPLGPITKETSTFTSYDATKATVSWKIPAGQSRTFLYSADVDNSSSNSTDGFYKLKTESLKFNTVDSETGATLFTNVGTLETPSIFLQKGLVAALTLDIDLNAKYEPLTDGLLIQRYLFGFTGAALTDGAIGSNAHRTSAPAIIYYLDTLKNAGALDADGNGKSEALTDGTLIQRYLYCFTGTTLTSGAIGSGATRTGYISIQNFLAQYAPGFSCSFGDGPIFELISTNIDGIDDGAGSTKSANAEIKIRINAGDYDVYLLDFANGGWIASSSPANFGTTTGTFTSSDAAKESISWKISAGQSRNFTFIANINNTTSGDGDGFVKLDTKSFTFNTTNSVSGATTYTDGFDNFETNQIFLND